MLTLEMFKEEGDEFMRLSRLAIASGLFLSLIGQGAFADEAAYPTPLAEEIVPNVETLPADYPDSWILVHDFNFNSMVDARLAIVDVSGEGHGLKGVVPASHFAHFLAPDLSNELYVAETYYSRMVRGERQDVITIYDRETLAFKDEILLPDGKRAQMIQMPNNFQFTNAEKWALVFNFTPASSVRIVDLENRKILNEVDVPGCMLTFPTGDRGFSTMCSDGKMLTILLDPEGQVVEQMSSEAFNDLDNNPLFMFPTQGDTTTHFLTFGGDVQSIDFSKDKPKILKTWSILDKKMAGWRPGGHQVVSSDDNGRLYALVHPDGYEGSHKDGGTEVWVYDIKKKKRIQRVPLKSRAWSMGVTGGEKPMMVTANLAGIMDVYDPAKGEHLRQLEGTVTYNPVAIFPAP